MFTQIRSYVKVLRVKLNIEHLLKYCFHGQITYNKSKILHG